MRPVIALESFIVQVDERSRLGRAVDASTLERMKLWRGGGLAPYHSIEASAVHSDVGSRERSTPRATNRALRGLEPCPEREGGEAAAAATKRPWGQELSSKPACIGLSLHDRRAMNQDFAKSSLADKHFQHDKRDLHEKQSRASTIPPSPTEIVPSSAPIVTKRLTRTWAMCAVKVMHSFDQTLHSGSGTFNGILFRLPRDP